MREKLEKLLENTIDKTNKALANEETGVVEQLSEAIWHLTGAIVRMVEAENESHKPEWEI